MGEGQLLADRYRLEEVVGRGGMGTVWRAHDVMLDRDVAIKEVVLPPGLTAAERDVLYERTFREARASARLNHPCVVTVHDVVQESGRPWIVMELVRARSLQDLIEQGPLPPYRVAEIGLQTLSALRAAHEKGILHRDVKPSNVLITDSGRVVLTDFGIAQAEGDSALTQTGLVMGSPAYIPPERARGERAVPASDLWSLGATLYAAVEGHSPFERSGAMSSLAAALSEPVPPPRNAGPLAPVLDGLLAREPAQRMTAEQAIPLLTRVASTRPAPRVPAPRPASPPVPPPASPHASPRASAARRADETVVDETIVDEPVKRFGAASVPAPARHGAEETVLDSAGIEVPTRPDTDSAPYGPGAARPADAGRPSGASRPSGGGDPGVRTVLDGDWVRPRRPPVTPEPWERPGDSYPRWQPSSGPGRDGGRERLRTAVFVTVVLVVVAAVLVGAYLLQGELTGG
ncbi:hypothetical protein Arub01_01900 [Actinomadura rubrobrunea]|uniref:non-specific serine/threonine protein kinase n=1 Tax=Actinomadura rubrobrunea TaxID=115335 RepID=A0A9W6PRL0_9ACTN|nr:serine/threonine-protein kinase [Actinomadura rubrobrunea]GLW61946.1 hypothetical protein Arub01_01900 [Actinomadura rubrobrunea]